MQAETAIAAALATVASAVAVFLGRSKVRLSANVSELAEHREKANVEHRRLTSALAAQQNQERGRIARLEHDLKSPLGVVLGFSRLLREYLEQHHQDLSPLPLTCMDGIDQAAQKMMQIVESASEGPASSIATEEAAVEERIRP